MTTEDWSFWRSGPANAALPILASTLLVSEKCALLGVPDLQDVRTMVRLLACMGVTCREGDTLTVDAGRLKNSEAPYDLVKTMRASILVLGPLVAQAASAVWSAALWAYESGWLAPVVPVLVVWLGAGLIDTRARMYEVSASRRRRLPHKQLKGYSVEDLQGLLEDLDETNRDAYAKSLRLDYWLAAAYGIALGWGFLHVRSVALPSAPFWLVVLPIATMIFDWMENALLRGRIAEFSKDGSLNSTLVRVASLATRAKLFGFAASILLLIGMLLWDYLNWPGFLGLSL